MHRIDKFVKKALDVVENHKIAPGKYARWIWQDEKGSRELGLNEYGCADAANILYSLGKFPIGEERDGFIKVLKGLQNPETGLFVEKTHHPIHTTAHCIAALELFDEKPEHKVEALEKYNSREKIREFLDGLNWTGNPWDASHQGAGIYVAMNLTDMVSGEWNDAYFDWLWKEADSETGFWRQGCVGTERPVFHSLAGSFHYLFNHEDAARALRYPEKMIDTCLDIWTDKKQNDSVFGNNICFAEVDWVYCLNRASRQTPHRFEESRVALKEFADKYIPYLNEIDEKASDIFNDLHMLFGAVCAVAELRQALPGYIRSDKKIKLVLDRRPFI